MQSLQRFEELVERLMEGSFARLFRSPIQPAEIAKRLEREMEAHPTISVGRTYVPNHYEVSLNPEDFAEFEPFRHSLEHNMAEFVSELAAERGYSLVSRPRVILKENGGTPRRGIEVDAHLSDEPAVAASPTAAGDTSRVAPREPEIARTHAMPQILRSLPQARPAMRSAAAPPVAYLQPLEGDIAGRDFQLNKTLLSIGRGLDNDLVIDDPRV